MKWSKFIQDENSNFKDHSPAQRLNTSKSRIRSSGKQLSLKSIEKAKGDETFRLNKNMSTSSINSSDLKMGQLISKFSHRPSKKEITQELESLPNIDLEIKSKFSELSEIDEIVDRFSKELANFIKAFIDKLQSRDNQKQFREAVAKRILNSSSDIFAKCLEQLPSFDQNSPIRKSISCIESNAISSFKNPSKEDSPKKKTRILAFKNQKVEEKNAFSRMQSTFNQMNRILQRDKQPRFMRSSRSKRGDRSADSSVQQVLERSMYDSRKGYRSRLKSKDALYNISKILNQ